MPVYAIILAGGASSRYWPYDGDETPKYALKPDGKTELLRSAWERCLSVAPAEQVLVVTAERQSARVQTILPALPAQNLLVEPCRRDTMAAVAYGVETVHRRNADGIAVITPADVLLTPNDAFAAPLALAREKGLLDGRLFSFGITPDSPHTGYGYLEKGEELAAGIFQAKRFVEKPDRETAQGYLESGNFLWNSGSFAWRAADFLDALDRFHPGTLANLRAFADTPGSERERRVELFSKLVATSVDYGIMEKAESVGVFALAAGFDDIGTWDALERYGHFADGDTLLVDSKDCAARTDGRVAFVGCNDLIVVQHGDDLLVMHKDYGQKVKEVSKQVKG